MAINIQYYIGNLLYFPGALVWVPIYLVTIVKTPASQCQIRQNAGLAVNPVETGL